MNFIDGEKYSMENEWWFQNGKQFTVNEKRKSWKFFLGRWSIGTLMLSNPRNPSQSFVYHFPYYLPPTQFVFYEMFSKAILQTVIASGREYKTTATEIWASINFTFGCIDSPSTLYVSSLWLKLDSQMHRQNVAAAIRSIFPSYLLCMQFDFPFTVQVQHQLALRKLEQKWCDVKTIFLEFFK